MNTTRSLLVQVLQDRGVNLPHPESVFVGAEVDPARIAPGVCLHPGTRLLGASLSVGPGSEIGGETPATVDNCQLGRNVSLKGGFFQGSVFLDGSSMGSAAHVRPGCLLEEEASGAHAVGLKQSILLPYVTLGSLINFCDVLMAGGTSRKNHSEVGSSFIHFNYTPHADKATASLIGDVPRGVLLDQAPIFLGGQGGMVGPVTIEYGVVQAAGSLCRRDLNEPGHLFQSGAGNMRWFPYTPGSIHDFHKRLDANLRFIGNLRALRVWHRSFRRALLADDMWATACLDGADTLLADAMDERLRQLDKLAVIAGDAVAAGWPSVRAHILACVTAPAENATLRAIALRSGRLGRAYLSVIPGLTPDERICIRETLSTIVQQCAACGEALSPTP